MKYICQKRLFTIVLLFFLLGASGCGKKGGGGSGYSNNSLNSPQRSEGEAIGAVKALLKAESQPHRENRQDYETTMCSSQRAAYDSRCQPCAPGSPNFCIEELTTKLVEVPGPCRFPPSERAQRSAIYNRFTREWQVESNDWATGRHNWTVDDQSGAVVSGYCVFK